MTNSEKTMEDFEIVHELSLAFETFTPSSEVKLGEYYSYGNSVQLCLCSEQNKNEFWFSVRQSMATNGKQYLMLSYPPSQFDGDEKIPLVLVELTPAKTIKTLTSDELNELSADASELANKYEPLNMAPLLAVLGQIPTWAEIKHRM